MKRIAIIAAVASLLLPVQALAWGTTGHRMINNVGASALPASVPAFLRTPDAVSDITALGPEMDRLKDSGQSWDSDNDTGHFLDIGDDNKIAGVITLDALPPSFAAYDAALRAIGQDPFKEGYVPYTILDGWEQVRKDFAYYRAESYAAAHATSPADKTFFSRDLALRERLTIRDIGVWGHFVGDASQPLHITIHFNGWGDYPNPNGYTTNHIHSFFESAFVRDHAQAAAVKALVPAYVPSVPSGLISQDSMLKQIGTYLASSAARVHPLYELQKTGDFDRGSPAATAFVDQCLAAGATQFRNWIALAWEDSLNESVSYPNVNVRDILSGKVPLSPRSFASD
ncbi:MAG: S1/P1 Nuclease [Candidatus Eremiobacteraeota bacterium]|nr:S1/P1 Nuclease [Candidatus Eremiobacteraeota bacterium]